MTFGLENNTFYSSHRERSSQFCVTFFGNDSLGQGWVLYGVQCQVSELICFTSFPGAEVEWGGIITFSVQLCSNMLEKLRKGPL